MSPQNFRPGCGRYLGRSVVGLVALLALTASAEAQTKAVERTVRGPTAKDIRVGVYLNVQPDCTTGVLPAIRLIASPANGTVNVKRGKVTATHYKQCMALEVPGFIAFYRSRANFAGTDTLTLEVKYPHGRTEVQKITVKVGETDTPRGRNI